VGKATALADQLYTGKALRPLFIDQVTVFEKKKKPMIVPQLKPAAI